jgi:hypothetical protein
MKCANGAGDEFCKCSGCNRSLIHASFPTSSSNDSRLSEPIQGIHSSHARERLYIKTARQGAHRLPISHDLHHDLLSLFLELHLYCEIHLPHGVTFFNLNLHAFGSSELLKSLSKTKYSQNPVTTWPWTNASPPTHRAASSSTSQYCLHLCCNGTWGEGCTHNAVVTAPVLQRNVGSGMYTYFGCNRPCDAKGYGERDVHALRL